MKPRTFHLLLVLLLLLPAAGPAAIRLIERNNDGSYSARNLGSLRVTADGVVLITPDEIFAGGFQ